VAAFSIARDGRTKTAARNRPVADATRRGPKFTLR
jgi:hypothetical protein